MEYAGYDGVMAREERAFIKSMMPRWCVKKGMMGYEERAFSGA